MARGASRTLVAAVAAAAAVLSTAQAVLPPVRLANGVEVPAVALGVGYHHLIKNPNATAFHSTGLWLAAGGVHGACRRP